MTWDNDDDDDLVRIIARMLDIPIQSVSEEILDTATWPRPAEEYLGALQEDFDIRRLYQTALTLLPDNLPTDHPWARRREVLRFAWEKKMTQQEIAMTLGCDPGTVIKDKKVLRTFIERVESLYLQIRNALPPPQQILLRWAVVYEVPPGKIACYAHRSLGMDEEDCLNQLQRIRQDFIQRLQREL